MKTIKIIVPDSGPLITLALSNALDTLLLPGVPIYIPDMVRHEVIRDMSKPGAADIAKWIRLNEGDSVRIVSTEVYEEYLILMGVNPATRTRNRGEMAAAEVLAKVVDSGDVYAVLLFEDSAVAKQNFLVRLPQNVLILSTSSFLDGLQRAGKILSADEILAAAVRLRGAEVVNRTGLTPDGEGADNWVEDYSFDPK